MPETPDLTTLPQRVRYASGVLQELRQKDAEFDAIYWDLSWRGIGAQGLLCCAAKRIEDEDRAVAERQKWAGELARDIAKARGIDADWPYLDALTQRECLEQADRLLVSGWRKGGDPT